MVLLEALDEVEFSLNKRGVEGIGVLVSRGG